MQCKAKIYVTGVKRGKGEFEGRPWSNCKVATIEKMLAPSNDMVGLISNEYRADYSLFDSFSKVPGIYDVEIEANEKRNLILSAKLVGDLKIEL